MLLYLLITLLSVPLSLAAPLSIQEQWTSVSDPLIMSRNFEIRPVSDAEEVLKIALNLSKPEEFMKTRALKVLDGDANLEVAN